MTTVEDVFLFGASGHAKVVIDILERVGRYRVVGLYDDDPALQSGVFLRYPLLGGRERLLESIRKRTSPAGAIVTIGDNHARRRVAQWLQEQGCRLVNAQHPSSQIARDVDLGPGVVIAAGAVVNPATRVAEGAIVNTAASIDHDCSIEPYAHIAPGSRLCGGVHIGSGTLIGAGSVIIPGIRVGCDVVVGAGSVLIRNVPSNTKVAGCPARVLGATTND
jgi:sugar O-acyltransferase (sialic acid O-acetyltransferase NeuD family)